MAKRTEGCDEAILQCAKEEFLERGYEAASLRTIAKNASVSTSMIYTRFRDKEGLFKAVIAPAAEKLRSYMQTYMQEFESLPAERQVEQREAYSDRGYRGFLDLLYENFDEFKLMITGSTNNIYRDYLEQIVELDVRCTVEFLKASGNTAYREGRITDGFIHILSSGFYSGLFELAVHNVTREESEVYMQELAAFYSNGWNSYL